jgi:hypothetical protein
MQYLATIPFPARAAHCDDPTWVAAYADTLCRCKPGLSRDDAVRAAQDEHGRQARVDPKTAAVLDATFGPLARGG